MTQSWGNGLLWEERESSGPCGGGTSEGICLHSGWLLGEVVVGGDWKGQLGM